MPVRDPGQRHPESPVKIQTVFRGTPLIRYFEFTPLIMGTNTAAAAEEEGEEEEAIKGDEHGSGVKEALRSESRGANWAIVESTLDREAISGPVASSHRPSLMATIRGFDTSSATLFSGAHIHHDNDAFN